MQRHGTNRNNFGSTVPTAGVRSLSSVIKSTISLSQTIKFQTPTAKRTRHVSSGKKRSAQKQLPDVMVETARNDEALSINMGPESMSSTIL